MRIKGQSALVTGGASGLGEATARALAAAGAKVAILDYNKDGALKVAGEIGGVGKSLPGDEQRHRKANAGERAGAAQLPPGIFFRFNRDVKTHRQPRSRKDAERLPHNESENDRQHEAAVPCKNIER